MKKIILKISLIAIFLFLSCIITYHYSTYTVKPYQAGIVYRFNCLDHVVAEPGRYFKFPFIDKILYLPFKDDCFQHYTSYLNDDNIVSYTIKASVLFDGAAFLGQVPEYMSEKSFRAYKTIGNRYLFAKQIYKNLDITLQEILKEYNKEEFFNDSIRLEIKVKNQMNKILKYSGITVKKITIFPL